MNFSFGLILFLQNLSRGIFMPVTSLLLLSRGTQLSDIAWLMGLYSFTVICMEFPSGAFCDLFGRKRTFLLSCLFSVLSLLLFLLFPTVLGCAAALILHGLEKAFASGSLEALCMEQALSSKGESALAKVSNQINLFQCLGIGLGSLLGGLLSQTGSQYSSNLLSMLIFSLLLMLLTFLYVKETPVSEKSGSILCELKNQVQKNLLYTRNSPGLRKLLFLSLCTGMVLFTVETYWQPALTTTFPQIKGWILGLLPFSGFFCTALGSQLGAVLLNRPSCRTQSRWWSVFFAGKFLLAASVVLFSFQQGLFLYAAKYSLIYFVLGYGSVSENALLNRILPNNMRASILSLSSLTVQLGALLFSIFAGFLINYLHFSGLWCLGAGILFAAVLYSRTSFVL